MKRKIERILIANRGEIAVRIIRTCKKMGIATVIVHSTADRGTPAVRFADQAVEIGPPEAAKSYLDIEKIVEACKKTGADAVHPGYGFLSERPAFASRLEKEGIIFIGPSPDTIKSMGDKIAARRLVEKSGVPVVPGYDGDDQSDDRLSKEAAKIGYPIMVKASAGGGGKGMRRVEKHENIMEALSGARREAKSAFGDDALLIEKYVERPRHIEMQVFGDEQGNVVHIFERECSIQRRHQKIMEESPSPALTPEIRAKMADAAVRAAKAVHYKSAGTVEFIYSDTTGDFYFLEMNTRLQVEHPVTELVTGLDLVEQQIRVARGESLSFTQNDLKQTGHAIEVRLYAEDPARNFMPATGMIHRFEVPDTARVDSGIESGGEVSIYYDPMIAKVITHGENREAAIEKMQKALKQTVLFGPANNIDFLLAILESPAFRAGKITTDFIPEHLPSYRGYAPGPDELELVRTLSGLIHSQGGKFAERYYRERDSIASQGGDLAPWYSLEGFQIWKGSEITS